jgi:hypothetical protein
LYSTAYTWPVQPLPPPERISSRTLRQYIKGWITQWDLRRLYDGDIVLVSETMTSDYTENATLAEPRALDNES